MDDIREIVIRHKPAVVTYALGLFLLTFAQLLLTWWISDLIIDRTLAMRELFLLGLSVPFALLGLAVLLRSLYLWMRPIALKSFLKRMAALTLVSLGLGVVLGIFLGILAMIALPNARDGFMFGRIFIDILGTLGGIPISAYVICLLATIITTRFFSLRIPPRLFFTMVPIMAGAIFVQTALEYLPNNVFIVVIRAAVIAAILTAVFVVAVVRAQVDCS